MFREREKERERERKRERERERKRDGHLGIKLSHLLSAWGNKSQSLVVPSFQLPNSYTLLFPILLYENEGRPFGVDAAASFLSFSLTQTATHACMRPKVEHGNKSIRLESLPFSDN
jgi:hypothetical protein